MTRRRRPPLTIREAAILAAMALGGLAVCATLIAADIRWSALVPGGGDYFGIYAGARAFVLGSGDPYGVESAAAAQQLVYGGPAPIGANPYRLNLPFFLLPLFFPFAFIPDPQVARGLWAFLSQLAVIATAFLSLRLFGWSGRRIFIVVLCMTIMLSLYVIVALANGSLAILLGFSYAGILYAMEIGQDELAGALIALSLCVWEVGLVFLLLVAWRVFHDHRWRIVAGFGMTVIVLLALSFLLFPGWLLPFLVATVGMIRSPHGTSTTELLLTLFPESGAQLSLALAIIVLATLTYEWAVARSSDFRRFVWISFLALSATPLLGMRTEIGNLVVLMPSVALVLASALQRRRTGVWFGMMVLASVLVVPWYLSWRWYAVGDHRAQDLLVLFLPGVNLLGMYWTRWWYLKPSRTWLDDVRSAGK